MVHNECIFLVQSCIMGCAALVSLRLGKDALIAFISVSCILANLFVVKQITLCGFTATASDAYSIGAVLGLNLLQEYYDRSSAQKAILISFLLLIFYGICSQIQLAYTPCIDRTIHHHYVTILSHMPRIIIASLGVYIVVQYYDAWLYAKLKKKLAGRYLVIRNIITIGLCQLLDTVLFSYLALYGIVDNIDNIIIVSYSIKIAAIILSTPFIKISRVIKA
jgi:uncharacterized integral membrane protein (TIGR00697 family)